MGVLHRARPDAKTDAHRSLAELATKAGTLRAWPADLASLSELLANAMGVQRYVVASRETFPGPFSSVLTWPDPAWLGPEPLDRLTMRVAHLGTATAFQGCLAVPGPAPADGIVLVVPERTGDAENDEQLVGACASLLAAMKDRAKLVSGLVDMANTDSLTGLPNRYRLFGELQRELAAASRSGRPLSVALIDLDRFRVVNDRHGHAVGDQLLREFARQIRQRLRVQDVLSRFGGEEFMVVLPGTDTEGAMVVVDALRMVGSGLGPEGFQVTFSAGVATWDGVESEDELVFRADARLHAAKAAGRDQVVSQAPLL